MKIDKSEAWRFVLKIRHLRTCVVLMCTVVFLLGEAWGFEKVALLLFTCIKNKTRNRSFGTE
jgi:hypothetical protein